MTIETVQYPRTPLAERKPGAGNRERGRWVFMRVSGILLVALVFVHLYSNLVAGDGITQVEYSFVLGKFLVPFWLIWDALLLVLALLHGTNGMTTLVNDYVYKPGPRKALITTLWVAAWIEIVLGLIVLAAFAIVPCMHAVPGICS